VLYCAVPVCRLSGRIYQSPTVGDVDGEGVLDVVLCGF
jgi:hypothetical protein